MSGSVNGIPIERGHVTIPEWGVPWADVKLSAGDAIDPSPGAVALELGGLSMLCTVYRGGTFLEGGWLRLVGGYGGWRSTLPAKGYRNAAGVKLSTVLTDAAAAAGERLGPLPATRIGPAYVRPVGQASDSLELLVRSGWYVDAEGVTQIGARPSAAFEAAHVVLDQRPDMGLLTISAEDLSTLQPGVTVDGQVVASVRHELTGDALRSYAWTSQAGAMAQLAVAFRKLVQLFTRHTRFFGVYEYRVEAFNGGYVDLRPARKTNGLPPLTSIELRSGHPGGTAEPQEGSSVLVAFADGEPTRPVVISYEGQAGNGYLPSDATIDAGSVLQVGPSSDEVNLGAAAGRVLRSGEKVFISGLTCPSGAVVSGPGLVTIALDPLNIVAGPPGTGFSKVAA